MSITRSGIISPVKRTLRVFEMEFNFEKTDGSTVDVTTTKTYSRSYTPLYDTFGTISTASEGLRYCDNGANFLKISVAFTLRRFYLSACYSLGTEKRKSLFRRVSLLRKMLPRFRRFFV